MGVSAPSLHRESTDSLICCLTPMSYLLNSTLCFWANFLKIIHNFMYQNPCLISLFVSSLCLLTKLEYVWHILLILMSYEIYTPYVGLAGMLLHMYGKLTILKSKLSLLSNTSVTYLYIPPQMLTLISRYDKLVSDSVVFLSVSSGGYILLISSSNLGSYMYFCTNQQVSI